MTSSVAFYFVDVFADRPLTGNPVSLVPDADELTGTQMRAIAREFNQSETTFVMRPSLPRATWRLRSFTPVGAEVFGAGHNTLGAWLWMVDAGRVSPDATDLAQEVGREVLPVEVVRHTGRPVAISMDQNTPRYGECVRDRAELASSLGLAEDDVAGDTAARVVSTGAGHLLVPLRDRAGVDRAAPDTRRLGALLRDVAGEGCYLYSRDPVDTGGAVAYARFFNPTMGIPEDPATGTAAGPLVALLVGSGELPDGSHVVEQGRALGRPSRISVTVDGPRVRVSGSGLVVASGTLAV